MKLGDLRRLCIRRQVRIHFQIANGMECVMTEHGIAEVPGMRAIPDFNLEEQLQSASEFLMESAGAETASRRNTALKPRRIERSEMVSMAASHAAGAAPAHEHEEE
jgi:hypothetical protein